MTDQLSQPEVKESKSYVSEFERLVAVARAEVDAIRLSQPDLGAAVGKEALLLPVFEALNVAFDVPTEFSELQAEMLDKFYLFPPCPLDLWSESEADQDAADQKYAHLNYFQYGWMVPTTQRDPVNEMVHFLFGNTEPVHGEPYKFSKKFKALRKKWRKFVIGRHPSADVYRARLCYALYGLPEDRIDLAKLKSVFVK